MARSRVEKFGTIFQRMNGLIKSGAVKSKDRPLWFDVYKAFPPKRAPKYEQDLPDQHVRTLLYPEDIIRARLSESRHYTVDLKAPGDTESEKFVQKYLELRSKADPGTDVFKQTLKALHPLHKKDVQVVKDKKIVEEKKISLLKQMLHGLKDKGQAQETPADDILDEHMLEQLFNEMPEIDSVNETDGSVNFKTDESVKLPVEDYSVFDEKNFKS